MFLIRRDPQTQLLDFSTVVALDAEQRAVVREEVATTTDVTDPEQLSLRIRWGVNRATVPRNFLAAAVPSSPPVGGGARGSLWPPVVWLTDSSSACA